MEFSSLDVPPSSSGTLREALSPGRWVKVTPTDDADAIPVDYYAGLFDDAQPQKSHVRPIEDRKLVVSLSTAFSIDHIPDSSADDVAKLLPTDEALDFLSVLDVGQGNANALWRSHGGVVLYFDLGGGVTANARTFPKNAHPLCFSWQPPIILSHWDWDHWSSACRFPRAFESVWVVPRPLDLGPTHVAFAAELVHRGNLRIWPRDTAELGSYSQSLRIQKCTGTDRNNGGLAMVVRGKQENGSNRCILLSGDASYEHIPAVNELGHFDAIVVSHHGGIVGSMSDVRPLRPESVLIYSVGHANYYGHPRLHAALAYLQAGWTPERTFSTAQHIRKRPTHIAISLSNEPVITGCRTCDPAIIC